MCYAERHHFIYHNEMITIGDSPYWSVTYEKLDVVNAWMRQPNCTFVWRIDSDVMIVDTSYSILSHLRSIKGVPDPVIGMTDHHAVINNGGFLTSIAWSAWASFFQAWKPISLGPCRYTDNGSMWEMLLNILHARLKRKDCPKSGQHFQYFFRDKLQ